MGIQSEQKAIGTIGNYTRLAVRLMTRSIRSTPRVWTNLILGSTSLVDKSKEIALKRAIGLKQEVNWIYTLTNCQKIDLEQ